MPDPQPLDLVLVEDNEDHALLVEKTLSAERICNRLTVFQDAESALSHLRSGAAERPQLILLDINLPGMDGLQLLKELKTDENLKKVPVVILSTSDAESDRSRAYAHSANSYLVKPVDFQKFRQMIRDVGLYWGLWNQPPA